MGKVPIETQSFSHASAAANVTPSRYLLRNWYTLQWYLYCCYFRKDSELADTNIRALGLHIRQLLLPHSTIFVFASLLYLDTPWHCFSWFFVHLLLSMSTISLQIRFCFGQFFFHIWYIVLTKSWTTRIFVNRQCGTWFSGAWFARPCVRLLTANRIIQLSHFVVLRICIKLFPVHSDH